MFVVAFFYCLKLPYNSYMTTLIIKDMLIFTVFLFTQLLIDFKPTVFATDYVDEVISSSYFSNYLRSLSIEHTIDVTSILSVVR